MLCFSWPLRNGKPRGRDNAVVYLNSRPDAPAATRGLVPVTVKISPGAGDTSAFSASGLFCIYRAISRILSTFQRSSEPLSMKSGP